MSRALISNISQSAKSSKFPCSTLPDLDLTNSFGGSKSLKIKIVSLQITKTKPKISNKNFH